MKNRILRILVMLAWLPALALVGFVALWGLVEQKNATVLAIVQNMLPNEILRDPVAFRPAVWTLAYSFFFKFEMYCIMLLVVVAGPGLISRDLRFNALPLYFARPMTRLDYFVGKLGVMGALVATVAVGPAVVAYVVGICFSFDTSVVKDTYPLLLGGIAYGLVVTLSVGTLMLALSSLTRRSLYVGIAWAGLWLISGSVATIMTGIHDEAVRRGVREDTMTNWLAENPPPPGVKMYGTRPDARWQPEKQKMRLVGLSPDQEEAGEKWYNGWQRASQDAWMQGQLGQAEASRDNGWPVCSYVGNVNRMADVLLDTDSAWVKIGKSFVGQQAAMPKRGGPRPGPQPNPQPANERLLADQMVPQYPWWWSGAVLVGLLGISTWTMTRRVKSLDRLK